MTSPTGNDLHGVWGVDWDDVWAVGNATVLHYDGTGWSIVADADVNGTNNIPNIFFNDIWAAGNKVWAAGENGTIVHYDGSTWTNQTTSEPYTLNGIWGAADNDIWAVGANATAYHYTGSTWPFAGLGGATLNDILAIHGRSANSIYVTTNDPGNQTAIYYNGSTWTSLGNATNDTTPVATGVWADPSSSDAWFVTNALDSNATAFKHDGSAWSDTTNGTFSETPKYDIHGLANDDIYVVGDEWNVNSTIRHWDGTSWSGQDAPANKAMYSVWGIGNSTLYRVYAVGVNGTIWVYQDNLPTISSLTAVPDSGPIPLDVTFSCTASDPDGNITSYRWDVNGDSSIDYVGNAGNSTLEYTYASAGSYNATCTVVDNKLQTFTDGVSVTATGPNKAPYVYSVQAYPDRGAAPLYVSFTCSAYDDDGISEYRWDFDGNGSTDNSTNASSTSYTYNSTGTYFANCTVYDIYNATTTVLRRIDAHSNNPPVISSFSATPLTGDVPLRVTFNVAASGDNPLSHYAFYFSDNGTLDRVVNATLSNSTTCTYTTEGTVNATVKAYDSVGLYTTSSPVEIEVRPTKMNEAPTQSGVSTISVDTQDTYPMSSTALIAAHNISSGNFTSLTEVREFTSTITPAAATGTYRYKITGIGKAVYELRLYKLLGGSNVPFAYADSATPGVDGSWWLTEEDGTTYVSASTILSGSSIYYLYFCVRDNGSYDLDTNSGSIHDPQVLGSAGFGFGSGGGGGGGGGGGCSAGAAGPGGPGDPTPGMAVELIVLLALAGTIMVSRRKRRR